jgi:bifunctional non-homologous end joining protein LigD
VPFSEVKRAACEVRDRLKQAGLDSALKCTGGKGLHIVVSLVPTSSWDQVKDWARALANKMVREAPDKYVATITKAKRIGKILIDFFRNDYTATSIASYSLRARPGAPVAVPLNWHELTALKSADQFNMEDVLKRIKRRTTEQALAKQRLAKMGKQG